MLGIEQPNLHLLLLTKPGFLGLLLQVPFLQFILTEPVFLGSQLQAELSPAPEFRGISRILEFSENSTENSTEFLCYFQNWSKMLQKASECYQNLGKAPEIAQNFYIFVKSA